MHYNHFTIGYLNAIKRNLKIEINSDGFAVFLPDKIKNVDIENLKTDIQQIWSSSDSAINIVKSKHDATVQSGLFGIVNELDTALKVGFLIGDRIVLIDYLYERVLLRKKPSDINLTHLGVIANSLVNALPLAEKGRIIIIPNPFGWNPGSKQIINEVVAKTTITPELMSLLNMLSITKICRLHPYTIAESESNYNTIIQTQIDKVDLIGRDAGEYAYQGVLGALLTEKLLKDTKLILALGIPLSDYFAIISSNKDFYLAYLSAITSGGSLNGQNNIDSLKNKILKCIDDKNKIAPYFSKVYPVAAEVGGGIISLAGAINVISAPLMITGAILALSGTLTGLLNKKSNEEQSIISLFSNLYKT